MSAAQQLVGPPPDRTELERLRHEHGNISRLLTVLESHLASVHAGEGFDEGLMLDALSYVMEYIDRFHHGREAIFVEALAVHQPTVRAFLATLAAQHTAIQAGGAALRERLRRAVEQPALAAPDREQLVHHGFTYCTDLRRTMSLEETVLSFATAALAGSLRRSPPIEPSAEAPSEAQPRETSVEERYRARFEELTSRIGCDCAYAHSR